VSGLGSFACRTLGHVVGVSSPIGSRAMIVSGRLFTRNREPDAPRIHSRHRPQEGTDRHLHYGSHVERGRLTMNRAPASTHCRCQRAVSGSSTVPAPMSVSSPRRFFTAPGMVINVSPACVAAPSAVHASGKGECRRAPCVGAVDTGVRVASTVQADTVRRSDGHRASERRTPCVRAAGTVRRAADPVRQGGGHCTSGARTPCAGRRTLCVRAADTVRRGGGHCASGRRTPCVRAADVVRRSGGHRVSGRRTPYVGAADTVRRSSGHRASERRVPSLGWRGTVRRGRRSPVRRGGPL
jgi:hypothetical protein